MIRILAGLVGLATLGFAAGAFWGHVEFYLPLCAVCLCAVLLASQKVPMVMRFAIGLFALSFLLLGGVTALHGEGLFPVALESYLPPPSASIVAAILAVLHLAICYVPVIRHIIDLANPFFEARDETQLEMGWFGNWRMSERTLALSLFGIIIVLNVFQVYLSVWFNYWNNKFYTSLQDKDIISFWILILSFTIFATIYVVRYFMEFYLTYILRLHWRRWLSGRYIDQWLSDKVHYRLSLAGNTTDNPDQRIAEDVRDFVDQSFSFYISIFSTSLTLYAFVQILWGISARFSYKVYGFDLSQIPGYLVWIVLILAIAVTLGTHLIGRPLIPLNFRLQKVEADFRYNLVRVRENTEQIALLEGEDTEKSGLMHRFEGIFSTSLSVLFRTLKLSCFTTGYGQALVILPYLLLAPSYFTTASMKLGDLTQTADAFSTVQGSFSYFITAYSSLAIFKSIVNRLTSFDTAIERAEEAKAKGVQLALSTETRNIEGSDVNVDLPGSINLLQKISFALRKGERTLVTGASGSGKTTLFRSIAGIWPYGKGKIALPHGEDVMLLPQQPYFPIGSLRATLAYPSRERAFTEDEVVKALAKVGLGHLVERLDEHDNWSNALSGGEKQKIAMVRAILRKPAWLLLDEATSAMDEESEATIYGLLREALPGTTIVSIGHRSSLAALHDRRLALVKDGSGTHVEEASLAAFGT